MRNPENKTEYRTISPMKHFPLHGADLVIQYSTVFIGAVCLQYRF